MKKLFSILTAFMLFAIVSYAQDGNKATQVVTPAPVEENKVPAEGVTVDGPIMTFETTEINYGVIEQHADPLRVFKFKNTGTQPLIIKHAKGSCGCTVPSYPKEAILPGEEGVIDVRYDTKRMGKFTKSVTLTTNETNPKRTLKIKGEVIAPPPEPEGVPGSSSGFGNNN